MKPEIVRKFERLAKRNAKRRTDPRFLNTMGFLTAKGFLGYNRPLTEMPNARIHLQDAIWAGRNVEPRILEVLPAALARLPKHFKVTQDPTLDEKALLNAAKALRTGETEGEPCLGVDFGKARVWMDLPLRDKRTRTATVKKRTKNFRLRPEVIDRLSTLARAENTTETEILERLVLGSLKDGTP